MCYCIYQQYHLTHQYKRFFDTDVICLQILCFSALINLSVTTDFPSLCVEYIFTSLSSSHLLKDLL